MIIVFAAGYGCLFAAGITRRLNVLEKIVLAVGVGLVLAVIATYMAVATKIGITLLADVIFLFSILVPATAWLSGKPKLSPPKFMLTQVREWALPAVLFSFHAVLWTAYMINYPYFPKSWPIDVVWHTEITSAVLRGIILPPVTEAGSHLLFAFASAYLGMDVFTSVRITPAFIETLSVLVAYCLFRKMLSTDKAAAYSTVVYSIILPSGILYYAGIGASANIVGDFFVMLSLLVAIIVSERITISSILVAVLVEGVALVSHISVLIFLMLVVGFSPVVFARFRLNFRGYLISNMGFIAFPLIVLVAAPNLVRAELGYISSMYVDFHNNLRVLMEVWFDNSVSFAGYLNFILLWAAFFFVVIRARNRIWPLFLALWFALLYLLDLIGTNDWRMVLLSFVPGAGLVGLLVPAFQENLEKVTVRAIPKPKIRRILVSAIVLALVVSMLYTGATINVVRNTLPADSQPNREMSIYESMTWLQSNSPPSAIVISIDLGLEYRYLPVIANRSYGGDFELQSQSLEKLHETIHFSYVAVSNQAGVPDLVHQLMTLREVYTNQFVTIYETLPPT